METAVLKEYLSALIDRYKAIYTARQLRKHIQSQISQLHNENEQKYKPSEPPKPPVFVDNSKPTAEIVAVSICYGLFVFQCIAIVLKILDFFGLEEMSTPLEIFILILCFALGIIYPFYRVISRTAAKSAARDKAEKDFEHAKKNYNSALANYEKRVEELSVQREQNIVAIEELKRKDKQLEAIITSAENTVAEYFDMNIVFDKYRHFVAVATFYEYLMSGRCDALEGRDGAYNLYETELRQNIIIGKLDEAVNRLSEIRDTQYVLCKAIQESNRTSREIVNELSEINDSARAIEGSSASAAKSAKLTEFYTAESARNTKILVDLNRGDFDTLVTKGGRHIIG
jgi:hypothetical protein